MPTHVRQGSISECSNHYLCSTVEEFNQNISYDLHYPRQKAKCPQSPFNITRYNESFLNQQYMLQQQQQLCQYDDQLNTLQSLSPTINLDGNCFQDGFRRFQQPSYLSKELIYHSVMEKERKQIQAAYQNSLIFSQTKQRFPLRIQQEIERYLKPQLNKKQIYLKSIRHKKVNPFFFIPKLTDKFIDLIHKIVQQRFGIKQNQFQIKFKRRTDYISVNLTDISCKGTYKYQIQKEKQLSKDLILRQIKNLQYSQSKLVELSQEVLNCYINDQFFMRQFSQYCKNYNVIYQNKRKGILLETVKPFIKNFKRVEKFLLGQGYVQQMYFFQVKTQSNQNLRKLSLILIDKQKHINDGQYWLQNLFFLEKIDDQAQIAKQQILIRCQALRKQQEIRNIAMNLMKFEFFKLDEFSLNQNQIARKILDQILFRQTKMQYTIQGKYLIFKIPQQENRRDLRVFLEEIQN